MERELVNIIEYLALGELEECISATYPHQQVFYDPIERRMLLQRILNQLPAVYMWLAEDECPTQNQLTASEQITMHGVVQRELKQRLQEAPAHSSPYSSLMTEVFY
jgi:hypothetical protein